MSKYKKLPDFTKFEVYTKLTDYIGAIQRSLSANYFYYTTGKLPVLKLYGFIEKLDPIYYLSEVSIARTRRKELNQVTIVLHIFSAGTDEVNFILMAREGCDGSKKHLFFEREKYKDARSKTQRVSIWHYEFLRINKEAYTFSKLNPILGQNETAKVKAVQGVWTLQLTQEYKAALKDDFRKALLRRNIAQMKSKAESITKLIGWHKVRMDYKFLKSNFEKSVVGMRLSDPKYPIKQLIDIVKLPSELRYHRNQNTVIKVPVLKLIEQYQHKVVIIK